MISKHIRAGLARVATYTILERQAEGFEAWLPIIVERCPLGVAWSEDSEPGSHEQAARHRQFGGWIWDEVNEVLPEGTVVVDLHYTGLTGCASEGCASSDCSLGWDVTDAGGTTRRINVPI